MNIVKRVIKRKKIIRAVIFKPDKRVSEIIREPKDGSFDFEGFSYIVTNRGYHYKKGIPTFYYKQDEAVPFVPHEIKITDAKGNQVMEVDKTELAIDAKALHSFKHSEAIKQLMEVIQHKVSMQTILFIILGAVIAGFGATIFIIYDEINALKQMIGGF